MDNTIPLGSGFISIPPSGLQTMGQVQGPGKTPEVGSIEKKDLGPKQCKTWSKRTYKDRSNDSSVSFQSPTHLSPEMAAAAVMAHEQEHVSHNADTAQKQGLRAISNVVIHNAVCPEWGRLYVSGGTTTTTYAPKQSQPGTGQEQNKGNFVNLVV